MNDQPILSIITVTYNCKDDLEVTLESILNQTFKNYELIIIDGGSKDGTLDTIKRYKERINFWVSESDHGIYDAMNKGIKVAQGSYLQFLNAGDLFFKKDSLQKVFFEYEKYDVIYGDIYIVDKNYNSSYIGMHRDFTIDNLKHFGTATVNHQAFFIKKDIAPFYTLKYRFKAELNWYVDIVSYNLKLKYKHIKEPLVIYKKGGRGMINFWRNLCEWITLTQTRFGLIQNIKNIPRYLYFIKYRYSR